MSSSDSPTAGIRVLGVSASPEQGATHFLVRAALLGAQAQGATTDFLSLAGTEIRACNGCGPCFEQGSCVIPDNMSSIHERMLSADVIIIGTPVYFGAPSALCKAFLERVEGLGVKEKRLRLKIGGSIAVAASDHGGQESAMASLHLWYLINDMIPIGITTPGVAWGVGGRATEAKAIETERQACTMGADPIRTAEVAWLYGRKLVTVAAIVQAGIGSTGLDLPDRPYGQGLPQEFPTELSQLSV